MDPIIFSLGPVEIRWYAVLILLGVIVAILLGTKESKKFNYPKDFVFDLGFYVVIFGIIGASLYFVLFNLELYQDWVDILRIWEGGLAIHGGIIAGFITTLVYCKIKKVNLFKVTDIAVISLIIAQAIGRWGNFFNVEAHGGIVTLSTMKSLFIPQFIIDGMNIGGVHYAPAFLIESLWCLDGFLALLLIRKVYKNLKVGELTSFYLVFYSIGRFIIESMRTDSLMIGGLKMAQVVSVVLAVIGVIAIILIETNVIKSKKYNIKEID